MVYAVLIPALTISVALVCYGVGFVVIRACQLRTFNLFEVFYATVVGLSTLTSPYALLATKGQTILALLPLLVLSPAWFRRPASDPLAQAPLLAAEKPHFSQWQSVLMIAAGAITFSLIKYAYSHSLTAGQVTTESQDYMFYSRTSYAFNMKGVEYPFITALAAGPLNPQAYHYLDLWANALLVKLTPIPSMVLLNNVVYSLMLDIVFIGFAAIYERYIARRAIVLLLALLSVFTYGIYWSVFRQISFLQVTEVMNMYAMPVIRPKIVPIFIFLLLGYYFLLERRYVVASWIWSALALVYTVVAPAAYISGGLLILYLLIRKKLSVAEAAWSLLAYGLVAIYIGAFYWIPNYLHPGSQSYSLGYLQYLPKISELRTVINSFIGTLLAQAIYYAPYLVLAGLLSINARRSLLQWRKYEVPLISIIMPIVVAAAIGAIFLRATDGYQLGINLMLPVIIISIGIVMGVFLQNRSVGPQLLAVASLMILLGYNIYTTTKLPYEPFPGTKRDYESFFGTNHDAGFVRQVSLLSPTLSRYGALMLDRSEYTTAHTFNSDISKVGLYLGLVRDNTLLVSLSVAEFDRPMTSFGYDTVLASYLVRSAPFTQFVQQQRREGYFSSMADAQHRFLMRNGINFICASSRVRLPPPLQQLVARTLTDPVSQQTLYVLNIPLQPKSRPKKEQLVDYMW